MAVVNTKWAPLLRHRSAMSSPYKLVGFSIAGTILLASNIFCSVAPTIAAPNQKARSGPRASLVPPPPPIAPLGGQFVLMQGMSPSFVSARELQKHCQSLSLQLKDLRLSLNDRQRKLKDRSERAQLFVSLFKEGVVSRRELESAQEDVTRLTEEVQVSSEKVQNVESQLKEVERYIKEIRKDGTKSGAGKK
jgi:hypothetical protein